MSLDEQVATLERRAPGPTPGSWTLLADNPLIATQSGFPTVVSVGQRLYAFGGDDASRLLMSDNGADWSDYATGIAPRRNGGGVLFQDQLFLTGGIGKSDTWATSNFKDWRQLSPSAGWGDRYGHALIPFGGRLFLAGGVKAQTTPQPDVWATTDGTTWQVVNPQAFPARLLAAGGVVSGQMVLAGGNGSAGALAEALVSTDGAIWSRRDVPWSARWGAQAVTIEGTLYLIGGEGPQGPLTDVWATRDAVNWVRVDNGGPALSQSGAGARGDQLVVLGGLSAGQPSPRAWGFQARPLGWSKIGSSPLTGDQLTPAVDSLRGKVWSVCGDMRHNLIASGDGIQWTDAAGNLPYEQNRAGVAGLGALWVSGGRNRNLDCTNDVWSTTDGTSWTQATPRAPWAGRNGHAMAVFNDRLWVMAGTDRRGGYFPDVWSSTDGAQWRLETNSAFSSLFAASAVVFANRLWMLGGSRVDVQVSSSADGVTWQNHGAPFPWRLFPRAHVIGDAIYLVGGYRSATAVYTDVWGSHDGLNWTQLESAGPWKNGRDFGSAVVDGAIVAFGGFDAARQMSADIYRYAPPPF
ncbi:MAG: kelch repeat-containing protein [Phenylobacterium sp.]